MQVTINIFPKKEILDPETRTVEVSLNNLGFKNFSNFSLGKQITFHINNNNISEVKKIAKEMCDKLLVNSNIEDYKIKIQNAFEK